MTDSQTVYASTDAIYVATQQWRDWNVIPEREWDQTAEMVTTTIHRFDATDPAAVEFTGSGEVAGWLYSQWAMSEHEGVLRVASTTQSPFWGFRQASSQSVVTVLQPGEGALETIGVVSGLGIDEQIYAVRFVGDAGYIVTFRQTDPLYVIDLSDPTAPQVAGELKIPGYSAYLHPIGDDLLVGVGQDADLNGQIKGTQVAVFDVSDPFDPRQVDKLTLPGAYSQAEWDHHAFLYWPATSTLVIPIQQSNGLNWWNGALAVHAGADGIRTLAEMEQPGYVYRTLVVGENLLTLSDTGIQSYDMVDFEESFVAGILSGCNKAAGAAGPGRVGPGRLQLETRTSRGATGETRPSTSETPDARRQTPDETPEATTPDARRDGQALDRLRRQTYERPLVRQGH